MREEVSRRLKLHVIGEKRLTIYAFGSQRPLEERSYRRLECWLRNWHDDTRVRIEALETPEISGDLQPPPDDCIAYIAQEQGLELADVVPDGYHPGFGQDSATWSERRGRARGAMRLALIVLMFLLAADAVLLPITIKIIVPKFIKPFRLGIPLTALFTFKAVKYAKAR
ncbi:hypothetical protein MTO96_033586 [Rhipicephalus appendiculatus]